MSIANVHHKVQHNCNGSAKSFAITFEFYDTADLRVILRNTSTGSETELVLNTDFSVTGGNGTTGTLTTLATDAYASGLTLTILRELTMDQSSTYTPGGNFPESVFEKNIDEATAKAAQVWNAGLILKETDAYGTSGTLGPIRVERTASKFLRWDAAGTEVEAVDGTGDTNYNTTYYTEALDNMRSGVYIYEHPTDVNKFYVTADDAILKYGDLLHRSASISELLDATTTGINALDTGALAANTWYYIYAIYNPTTLDTDCLISASDTAPTMPTGYTYKCRIGVGLTDATAKLIGMRIIGKSVTLAHEVAATQYSFSGGGIPAITSWDISGAVPPIADSVYLVMESSGVYKVNAWVYPNSLASTLNYGNFLTAALCVRDGEIDSCICPINGQVVSVRVTYLLNGGGSATIYIGGFTIK